jgi:hypothetical protein
MAPLVISVSVDTAPPVALIRHGGEDLQGDQPTPANPFDPVITGKSPFFTFVRPAATEKATDVSLPLIKMEVHFTSNGPATTPAGTVKKLLVSVPVVPADVTPKDTVFVAVEQPTETHRVT